MDDIFLIDPTSDDEFQESSGFSEFSDLLIPDSLKSSNSFNHMLLRTELEKRDIEPIDSYGRLSYRVVVSQARMDAIRDFAKKKGDKMQRSASAYMNALKGAMGETAVVILLRAYLEIFNQDPTLAKVNLRIHPKNDGGKDHLIAGVRINSKFSNNPKSGIFFSDTDLASKNDSDYFVLANGENVADTILDNSKSGSHIVIISGVVKSEDVNKENMSYTRNKFNKDRWIVELNSLKPVNTMISDIIGRLPPR